MKSSVLNLIYRFVYSEPRQLDSAVVEFVHVCARYSGRTVVAASLLIVGTAHAAGLPGGGQVVAGSGSISQSGNTLTVTQTSNRMATNWQQFSIGQGNTVNFAQPSASSVALNRVLGSDPSVIQGALHANGQVFLINPNGVLFSPTARVNVGGIVASTLTITNKDFMAGHYRFAGSSTAAVRNEGSVIVGTGGSAAFIAAHIENTGSINAPQGNVLMGAGNDVRLDLGGPVKIEVKKGALDALIKQGGAIHANGGLVYLTAKAAGDLASAAINHTGITEAKTLVTGKQGAIYLIGDMAHGQVNVSGTLNASAPAGSKGGFIETSAAKVKIQTGAQIQTGHWLIDPNDFTIAASGGDITGGALGTALGSGNVTIQISSTGAGCTGVTGCGAGSSGNGDIFVKDNVIWTSGKTLTLNAYRNIRILSTLDASGGTGGKVVLDYGQGAVAAGNAATYDFGLTGSGFTGAINLQAGSNFTTKLGSDGTPVNWTVITAPGTQGSTTGTDLQGINGSPSGNFVLGANIDATGTSSWNSGAGFVPIGNNTTNFTGNFDGLGHVINGLVINRSGVDYQGLFGAISGNATLANVGLIGGSVKGKGSVGALIGSSNGSSSTTGAITSSYATSSVTGSGAYIGGLVGANFAAIITNSYATGNVSGAYGFVGGLVGNLDAAFHNTSASVSNSYATGNVSGNTTTGDYIGGLVGVDHAALISNSYATGNVSGSKNEAGGLVGDISNSNIFLTVINSYATGIVSGTGTLGGLVGGNSKGTISNSFWDTVTTGQTTSAGGGTGKTTSNMKSLTTFTGVGWNIDDAGSTGNIWRIYNGNSYPLLRNLLTPLAVTANSGSRVYDGTITSNLGVSYSTTPNANLLGSAIVTASAKNAGARTLNVSGVYSNQNGYDISNAAGTLTITAKPVSLLASKTYDGSTSLTGVVTVNTGISGETLNYSGATANDAHVATANKFISAITLTDGTGGLASNYTLPTLNNTNAPVTITAATLTPTLSNVSVTKVYDGTTAALSGFTPAYTITGLVSGDTAATLGNMGSVYNSKDVATANTVTVSGLSITSITGNHSSAASDYVLDATSKTVAGTITKAPLLVTANNASKTYDGLAYSGGNGVSYSGFVNSETSSVLGGSLIYNGTSQGAKNAGNYIITPGGQSAANYTLNYVDGTLTINKASLTLAGTRVYNGLSSVAGSVLTASGVNGETFTVTGAGDTSNLASKNVQSNSMLATVTGLSLGTSSNRGVSTNYTALGTAGSSVTITERPLTISANASNKVYDGTTAASVTLGDNRISGDALNLTFGSAAFNNKNAGIGKTVNISNITLSGMDAGNYALQNTTATTSADITAKALTASYTAANKVYDGNTSASVTGSSSDIVTGDTVTFSQNAVFNNKNVGNGKTVNINNITLGGTDAGNYALQNSTAMAHASIISRPVTTTANTGSKVLEPLHAAVASAKQLVGNPANAGSTGTRQVTDEQVTENIHNAGTANDWQQLVVVVKGAGIKLPDGFTSNKKRK